MVCCVGIVEKQRTDQVFSTSFDNCFCHALEAMFCCDLIDIEEAGLTMICSVKIFVLW